MDTNEKGIISIECSLVLPIYVLLLLVFIYLMNYMTINDSIMRDITLELLSKENVKTNIYYRAIELDIDKYTQNDMNVYNIKYDYKMPLSFIDDIYVDKNVYSKIYKDGYSILDYGLSSEYIVTDYDIWALNNIARGKNVNEILGGFDSFDGSTIDKLYNGYLISLVSLDFRKESYKDDSSIFNKLKNDINILNDFKEGKVSNNYISNEDYKGKILNLIIPSDGYDNNVEKQLILSKNYAKNKNIQFKITIINS